ncbi:MAG: hypothetical protein RMJ44_03435 [Cytophagales bacterium]|nr:hypothetical protein [Bernardetiaceae bacterium]MDW8210117.1 hypothetical protein [Cytophagales bacterium]
MIKPLKVGLLAIVLLASCKKASIQPDTCTQEVTAVAMSCAAYGALNNIYFLTEEDKHLQPWEIAFPINANQIKAGKRYAIAYQAVKRDQRYQDLMRCMLYDEKVENAIPVKITCLKEVECGHLEATVNDMRPVDGCLEFILANGESLLPEVSHLGVVLESGDKVKFSYVIQEGIIPCGTRRPVHGRVAKVICLEKIDKTKTN